MRSEVRRGFPFAVILTVLVFAFGCGSDDPATMGMNSDEGLEVDEPAPCWTHRTKEACYAEGCSTFVSAIEFYLEEGTCVSLGVEGTCLGFRSEDVPFASAASVIYRYDEESQEFVALLSPSNYGDLLRGWSTCTGAPEDPDECSCRVEIVDKEWHRPWGMRGR